MGYIYIIKNDLNNKIYIGQTIQTVEKRWMAHLSCARNNYNTTSLIDRKIRQYGEEHFYIETLQWAPDDQLDNLEYTYILQYNSLSDCNGYNIQQGGKSLHSRISKHTDEIIYMYCIEQISSKQIAEIYKCSDETILNILKANDIEIRNNKNKDIYIVEYNIHFKNYYDTARWIIQNNLSRSKSVRDVAREVSTAYNSNNRYIGLTIIDYDEYINNGVINYKRRIRYARDNKCVLCGKPITSRTTTGLCRSCSQVKAKGKIPKPDIDTLRNDLNNLSIGDIASKYKRSESTVYYWIKQYKLNSN